MATVGNLVAYLNADISNYESGMIKAGGIAKMASATIVTAIVTAAAAISVKSVQMAAELEQTQIGFEVMTGSAEKAKDMIKEYINLGAKTPYEFRDLLDSARMMMLYGVSVEKSTEYLKMLGDVASGDAQKLKQLTYAFSQIQATGRLMGQDLLQMVNAGFNPLQIIAEKTGLSMADLKRQMEKGAISAQMVADAFKVATSEGGRFYGMMEKQSQTIQGLWSTFMDNINMGLMNLGTSLSNTFNVKGLLQGSINILGQLNGSYTKQSEVLGDLNNSYKNLASKTNLTVDEKRKMYEISNKIAEIAPEVVAGYTKEGNAIIDLNASLKAQILLKKQELEINKKSLEKQIKDTQKIVNENQNWIDNFQTLSKLKMEDAKAYREQIGQSTEISKEAEVQMMKVWFGADYPAQIRQHAEALAAANDKLNGLQKDYDDVANLLDGKVVDSVKKTTDSITSFNDLLDSSEGLKSYIKEWNEFAQSETERVFNLLELETEWSDEKLKINQDLTDKINEMTMSEKDYKIWALEQERIEFMKNYGIHEDLVNKFNEYYKAKMAELAAVGFKANFEIGLKESIKGWNDWSQHIRDIASETAQAMSQSMSDLFFDALTGKVKSLGDYFQSFLESVVRAFSNAMAQMVTQKLITSMIPGFASGGNFGPGPKVVGERGPELIWTKSSGSVTSNKDLQKLSNNGEVTIKEINIVNNTGANVESTQTDVKFDADGYIIGVVLNGIATNKAGIGDLMRGVRK